MTTAAQNKKRMKEILLCLVPSVDVFLAAFSYGVSKIKISKSAVLIIALVNSAALSLPLFASNYISKFLSESFCLAIGVTILLAVALTNICRSYIKSLIQKTTAKYPEKNCLNISKFGFVIEVYLDETKADKDFSMVLSEREAIVLAIAVAIDALATGFGAGFLDDINIILVVIFSFAINILVLQIGQLTGNKISYIKKDFSWLGGIILICVAISRIFNN
ncbi:sporulation membrane protein YtaF [Clostridia bacterium]|nr:sporulation membrane protein YtaF [Clostridia bacterium]